MGQHFVWESALFSLSKLASAKNIELPNFLVTKPFVEWQIKVLLGRNLITHALIEVGIGWKIISPASDRCFRLLYSMNESTSNPDQIISHKANYRDSLPQNAEFFWPVMLFIHLDCFGVRFKVTLATVQKEIKMYRKKVWRNVNNHHFLPFIQSQRMMTLIRTSRLTSPQPWELAHPLLPSCFCSKSVILIMSVLDEPFLLLSFFVRFKLLFRF